jgi:hypothetical protein
VAPAANLQRLPKTLQLGYFREVQPVGDLAAPKYLSTWVIASKLMPCEVNYAQGQSQTLSSKVLSEVEDFKGVALQCASERAGLGLLVKRICFSQYPKSCFHPISHSIRLSTPFRTLTIGRVAGGYIEF